MNNEKNHITYTAEDIKRYITGSMPAAEQHAMEMAALDDPLLAEAMEGYELMEQKDWSKELATLKDSFNTGKKEETPVLFMSKTGTFTWWRVAAAVLLIAVTAGTAYLFTHKKNSESPAAFAVVTTPSVDTAIAAKTDSLTVNTGTVAADSTSTLIAKLDKTGNAGAAVEFASTQPRGLISTAPASAYSVTTDSSFIYKPSPGSDYLAMKDKEPASGSGRREIVADEKAGIAFNGATANNAANNNITPVNGDFKLTEERKRQLPSGNATNNGLYYNNNNTFNGLVVTQDNKPVSYANITIAQNKKPVLTDAGGRFNVTSPDTALKVTVTSAGYVTQDFTLQNSATQNRIVLEPQEVAVTALGKKKEARTKEAVKWEETITDSTDTDGDYASPEGGWAEYYKYLNNNINLSEVAKQKNVHGEVEVTVKLNSNGEIANAKVTKPLSPECDAEAMRLVKEGPRWDVKNNKKNKIKVTVKF